MSGHCISVLFHSFFVSLMCIIPVHWYSKIILPCCLLAMFVFLKCSWILFWDAVKLSERNSLTFEGYFLGFVDGPRAAFGSNFFFIWRQYFQVLYLMNDHALWFFLLWLVGALSIPSPMSLWEVLVSFPTSLVGLKTPETPCWASVQFSPICLQILSTVAPPILSFAPHLREIAELLLGNPSCVASGGIFPRWCARAILGLTLGANLGLTFYVSLLCSV